MNNKLSKLTISMMDYFSGDPKRIQHFLKVQSFCRLIAKQEQFSDHQIQLLEAAAIVHDCGIKAAEKIYGKSSGKYQEELGPAIAEKMLRDLAFAETDINRICFLVGHHHSYKAIDGLDFQILVEADMLVNIYEDELDKKVAENLAKNLFKTSLGCSLLDTMYLKDVDYSDIKE